MGVSILSGGLTFLSKYDILDLNKFKFVVENDMIRFVHLFKSYYFGISFIGIIAFVIQEIPYITMPLIKPA